MTGDDSRTDKFPAPSKQAVGMVSGMPTTASCMHFSDKTVIILSQGGRLAQWIQVPLSVSPTPIDTGLPLAAYSSGYGSDSSRIPAPHLTPTTLLGAGGEARDTLGRLYAAQIASHLTLRFPGDRRPLLLGLGFATAEATPESLFDMMDLVGSVL